MNKLRVEDQSPEFQQWIADQDLDQKQKTLWNFHRWMRQETSLHSGSIVDYRKYVAEMLDDTGKLAVKRVNIESSHKRAAYTKFHEYLNSESFAKTNTKGENTE